MQTHINVSNPSGYADQVVTKAPEWYWLVVFDTLINSLTTGLFLVAALGELAAPATFTAVATWAYPIALVLLLTDLGLLILDLGDPLRFHHMLRVFKPSSPMSLGTWCLTIYALFLSTIVLVDVVIAMDWLPDDSRVAWWVRKLAVLGGLPFAFASAAYKGILFSTTAQPGWKDARWLGAYLMNSALLLGCGELLALSILGGHARATALLHLASVLLLLLNVLALGLLMLDIHPARALGQLVALVLGVGVLVPLFLLAVGNSLLMVIAVMLMVLGALVVRIQIVWLPHGIQFRDDSVVG